MVQPEEIDLYQRLHQEFEACRLLDRIGQHSRLEELRGSDPTLARELERLLHAAPDPVDPSSSGSSNSDDPLSDQKIDEARGPASWLSPGTARSEPPKQVGPFHILRELGAGGMGTVYEAEQTHPRRRVALKLIHPGLESEDRLRRFRQEGEALARLQHPGIAQVYQVASADLGSGEQPYLVMELVPGTSLRNYSKRAKLDPRAKLALVAEICDAVQHAHERGVVHRDLKPDNVLVDDQGQAKVLDFGIAQVAPGEIPLTTIHTRQGELVGTLTHMAPEQMEGDPDRVGPPADIYALGVIAFELLTGRLPHEIAGLPIPQAIRQISDHPAPRLGKIDRTLRGDPETIVGKALDQDPERRYSTAAALASDLRRSLRHEPISARPPSAIYLATSFTLRHRGFVVGTLLSLIAIVVGFVAVIASRQSVIDSKKAVVAAKEAETKARVSAEHGAIDARASAYLATDSTLNRNDLWSARDQLDLIQPEHRGWEWDWLDARGPLLLEGLLPRSFAIQGHHVAATPEDAGRKGVGPLVIVDLKYPERQTRVPNLESAFKPVSSAAGPAKVKTRAPFEPGNPDAGEQAVTAFVDLPSGQILEWITSTDRTQSWDKQVSVSRLTEDGTAYLAYRSSYGQFGVLTKEDRLAGRPARRSPVYPATVVTPSPSPTGDYVFLRLSMGQDAWFKIIRTSDMAEVADLGRNLLIKMDRKWERMARLDERGLLEILLYPSMEVIKRFQLPVSNPREMHWLRDEEVFVVNDPIATFLVDAREGTVLEKYENSTAGRISAVSPSAQYVVMHGGKRNLPWVFETQTPPNNGYRELRGHTHWIYHVGISPDGALIASAAPNDPLIRLWDGWTGEALATLHRPVDSTDANRTRYNPLAFTGDGRTLVTWAPSGSGIALQTYDVWTGGSEHFQPGSGRQRYRELRSIFGDLSGRRFSNGLVGHPDGEHMFLSVPVQNGDDTVRVTPLDERPAVHFGPAQGIGLSPDGKLLAVGGTGSFRLVKTSDLETVAKYQVGAKYSKYYAVAWSPDGQRLALGDSEGQVTLLETQYFRPIFHLPHHASYVYSLLWSPDGTRLITASGDKTLRIHDTLHGIPFRLRAKERAERAEEQLRKLDALVAKMGSVPVAIEALLADAKGDETTEIAARRACLLRWTREDRSDKDG